MRTTRRTFFATLTSSVAALVAIAKGKASPPIFENTAKIGKPIEIRKLSRSERLTFEADGNVTRGDMLFLGTNGRVTSNFAAQNPHVPIGIALNDSSEGKTVMVLVNF